MIWQQWHHLDTVYLLSVATFNFLDNPFHNSMQIVARWGPYYYLVSFDFLLGSICFGIAQCAGLDKQYKFLGVYKCQNRTYAHGTIFSLPFDISMIFQLFRSFKSSGCTQCNDTQIYAGVFPLIACHFLLPAKGRNYMVWYHRVSWETFLGF